MSLAFSSVVPVQSKEFRLCIYQQLLCHNTHTHTHPLHLPHWCCAWNTTRSQGHVLRTSAAGSQDLVLQTNLTAHLNSLPDIQPSVAARLSWDHSSICLFSLHTPNHIILFMKAQSVLEPAPGILSSSGVMVYHRKLQLLLKLWIGTALL